MNKTMKKIAACALTCYTLFLSYLMIWGFGRRTYDEYMYNLKPFLTISQFLQIDRFNTSFWIVNLIGNIGVFVPFGILISIIVNGRLRRSYLAFISGIFVLEGLQLVTRRGSFDIDDFILNSLGFLIGFGIYRMVHWVGKLQSKNA